MKWNGSTLRRTKLNRIDLIKQETTKFILFFIGLICIALGSVYMIKVSNLGVQPFDTFHIAVSEKLPITIGTSVIILGIILVISSFLLTKEKIKIGTILDTIFTGILIDLFLHIDFILTPDSIIWKYAYLLLGIILISLGSALTILSNIGAGPIDTFMLSICKTCHLSVKMATTLIEGIALTVGILLGGPFGFGTLLFLICIGVFIEFFLKILAPLKAEHIPPLEKAS